MEKRAQDLKSALDRLSEPEQRRIVAETPWEEEPCDIDAWLDSPFYMNLRNSDGTSMVWPSVREDLRRIFAPDARYNEAVLLESIGAGKTFEAGLILARCVYELECLENPARSLGIADGSSITVINMAPSGLQAKNVVFQEFRERIDNSPWFNTYCRPDPSVRSMLRFPKNVTMLPGNSSSRFPLGFSIYAAVLDEAAFLESVGNVARGVVDKTEEIYNALKKRMVSRFLDRHFFCIISSPSHVDDFAERKYAEARGNKRIYAVRRAIWEAKPQGFFKGETFRDEAEVGGRTAVIHVPVELRDDWTRNPHKARRDYAAIPSYALNPFMDFQRLEDCVEASEAKDPVAVRAENGIPMDYHPWFAPHEYLCAVHVDLGLSRDACGLAMSHWDHRRDRAVVDLMLRITTSTKKQLEFEKVRAIILKLRGIGFKLHVVSFDNFQSVDSRQILESKGIRCEMLSVDRSTEAYDTLLSLVNQGQLELYRYQPFLDECKRLELVNGKKVDHPPHGSKDVADAVAGSLYWVGELRGERSSPQAVTIKNDKGYANSGRYGRY